jgi:phosphoglycolate phosphatase
MKLHADGLILDLDGTLLDSKPGILESFSSAVRSVLPELIFDIGRVPVGPPIRQLCKATFPGLSESDLERLAKAYRAHYDSQGCMKTRLYEGVREVLSRCAESGRTMDVATNKPLGITTTMLSHFKIDSFFRSVVAVNSIQPPFAGKTDIIRHLLRTNRMDVTRTVYVGDTAEDAAAAQTCGIGFVWAAYGYGKLPDGEPILHTINKLAELGELL